jgi:hypothetical protein
VILKDVSGISALMIRGQRFSLEDALKQEEKTGLHVASARSSELSCAPITWCTGEVSEIVFVAVAEIGSRR